MTKRTVHIHLLPQTLRKEDLIDACVVVIDVFRASTTIVYALANGATKVIPVAGIEDAEALAESSCEPLLIAGERNAIKLDGCDLGNSPLEYSPERVNGRAIILTTSNGTAALSHVVGASLVIVGCFANISASVAAAYESGRVVHLVCSGTNNGPSLEDALAAGAMAMALIQHETYLLSDDDLTQLVSALAERLGPVAAEFESVGRRSISARRLYRLGLEADITTALNWNTHTIVPRLVEQSTFGIPIILAG